MRDWGVGGDEACKSYGGRVRERNPLSSDPVQRRQVERFQITVQCLQISRRQVLFRLHYNTDRGLLSLPTILCNDTGESACGQQAPAAVCVKGGSPLISWLSSVAPKLEMVCA